MNVKDFILEEGIPLYEMFIEDPLKQGVSAISTVMKGAIGVDFVQLSEEQKAQQVLLKNIDAEKRILLGPALIPNKPIYRVQDDTPYYIYFSENTVEQLAHDYVKQGNQANTTLDHDMLVKGVTLVESWIVEDLEHDKSRKYGFEVPVGTWMVSMKVDNDEIWEDYVKEGLVRGFSIEAMLQSRVAMKHQETQEELVLSDIDRRIDFYELEEELDKQQGIELETYNDYPRAATNNAKRAIKYKEENGTSCGTQVGWTRARQLANRESLTRSTIARMASFKRHQQHKDIPYSEGCGKLVWDCWGGSAGINWAIRKIKQIDNKKKD